MATVAHAAVRIENDDVDIGATFDAVDGSAAGVAAGCAYHHDAAVLQAEHVIEEAADELECDVFERECGAVKQLKQPVVVVYLHEWRDVGVTERGIGLAAQAREHVGGDVAAEIRLHECCGAGGIVACRKWCGLRPGAWHIEPAVGGEAGEQHVVEAEFGGRTAGGDVSHCPAALLRL
jgi:hypothetical protein